MKLFLFLILFFSFASSSDVNKYNNINGFYVSENGKAYDEVTYKKYKEKKLKNFTIKLEVNKSTLHEKPYYLTIITSIDSLKYTNANYFIKEHMMVVKLDSTTQKELYFEFSYDKPKRAEFRFNVVSQFEFENILPFEGILYGLAYGIIFCAFLYYLVIYFSTKKLCFIYYSFMQLFVLLSLVGFMYFSFQPYPKEVPQAYVDIFESAAFLFTFLFAKEILEAKKRMPIVNDILTLFVLINLLDIIGIMIFKYSILYEEAFFYINFLFPAIAGGIAIFKGNKYAVFYTIGWSVLFAFVYAYEHDIIPLSGIYTIHIAAPLESLIFSFALGYMLRDVVNRQNEHEKMLIHKSKLATVGEMINNIAHQWRQPLMHLSYINMNLEVSSENNEFEKEFFIKKIKESNTQIKFMSQTIDDFKDFYKVENEKKEFSISNACELAVNIISPTLKKKKVKLVLDVKNDSKILGYENEYAQVVLNFLTNSVDVFLEKKIQNPIIYIIIDKYNNKSITTVYDNGGGVNKEDLNKVFEPYFTTKKRGSGIGLYMSQLIVKSHFDGEINVSNKKDGACFKIEI